jgi:TonB family protein
MKTVIIALVALTSFAFAQQPATYVHLDKEAKPVNLKSVTDNMEYPENLALQGEEGTVLLRVLVDANGNYKRHQVVNSNNPQFTASAEKGLTRLQFNPAEHNGKAVTSWVFIPVKFRLADAYAIR